MAEDVIAYMESLQNERQRKVLMGFSRPAKASTARVTNFSG